MNDEATTGTWGPTDDWDALMAMMTSAGGPLADMTQIEELSRYDGIIIELSSAKDGSTWLHYAYDDGDRPVKGAATEIAYASHFLRIRSLDELRGTLNEGWMPTEESYRMADLIVSEKLRYVMTDGVASDCTGERRVVSADEALAQGSIYRQIRPDGSLTFGPFEDGIEELSGEDRLMYRYPVPQQTVLYDFDGPRTWIGTFDDRPDETHLVCCISDETGVWRQHRLTFPTADRDAVLETLAWERAPTMDTYRLAKAIHLETILSEGTSERLVVRAIGHDDPDFVRPTFDTVADHDRAWPDYARRK